MRILICHYNPDQGGGAESAVHDQAGALEKLGHTVAIEYAQPKRAAEEFKPDIVHFHTIHVGLGIGTLTWAQGNNVPHCLSLHDYWPFCSSRMLLSYHDKSCAAVDGQCDGRCCGAPQSVDWKRLVNKSNPVTFNKNSEAIFERHGIHIRAVIPHGIDTEMFCPDYSKRGDGVRIVTVSAWPDYPTKGMHILKQALKATGLKATLVSGVPRERVRDELQASDVFVFPSCYEETWGLCLTEAMACGCACISSDVAGPREQIEHGVTGLLFPNRDSDTLAEQLQMLVNDGDMRERLGTAARAKVEQHNTLERMARDYEALYQEIAGC